MEPSVRSGAVTVAINFELSLSIVLLELEHVPGDSPVFLLSKDSRSLAEHASSAIVGQHNTPPQIP